MYLVNKDQYKLSYIDLDKNLYSKWDYICKLWQRIDNTWFNKKLKERLKRIYYKKYESFLKQILTIYPEVVCIDKVSYQLKTKTYRIYIVQEITKDV